MRIRLIRHATLRVEYSGKTLLVDPMLDAAGARPAIVNSPNPRKNPLVELPIPASEVVKDVHGILVTHTHSDHWDQTASKILSKTTPLFGQREDAEKFKAQGFTKVQAIGDSVTWEGITISRTTGQHGTGDIGKAMAPVSGFVLQARSEPNVYIAGDTIWCTEVEQALARFKPDTVVVNAGGARFLKGDPITMTPEDVMAVSRKTPKAKVVAVHMDAINHCLVTRSDLAFQIDAARLSDHVIIPGDGEWIQSS